MDKLIDKSSFVNGDQLNILTVESKYEVAKPSFKKLSDKKIKELSDVEANKDGNESKAIIIKNLPQTTRKINIDAEELVEPFYTKAMDSNIDYCVAEYNENLVHHVWSKTYWQSLSTKRTEALAFQWLKTHVSNRATAKLAKSCVDTSALSLLTTRTLPSKSDKIIIPLENCWLEIDDKTNQIKAVEPNRNVGITHLIKASVDFTKDQIYYPQAPGADSLFMRLLVSSLPDQDSRDLLQEFFGSSLIPDTRYQKALVMEGKGSNGKGVIAKILAALHHIVATVKLDKLNGFGLSELPNASLVTVAETPKKSIDEEMLKQLISGDLVVIDIKNKSQFSCAPFAKWLISCNQFPKITDETDGVWRRLMIMKFTQQFLESDKIQNLDQKIINNELHIVLDWALIGLQRLLARGENGDFKIPDSIKNNTESEKANSNNVIPFIDDTYLEYGSVPILKDKIYERYIKYCENHYVNPYGEVQFWKRINQKFPDIIVTNKRELEGRKRYVNLRFNLDLAIDSK